MGVTLEHDAKIDQPYARTFYPGVPEVGEATVFDLEAGQRLGVGAFTLPPRLIPITIEGIVVRENGKPAPDVFVAVANNRRARLPGTRTDKNGRFSVSVFPGYSYVLTATLQLGQDALVGRATYALDGSRVPATHVRIELRPRASGVVR